METMTEHNAFELARMASVASPDTLESPGAEWLKYVQVVANEARDENADPDELHEWADQAVPIYTHERWQVFVDLAAYQEDDEGLCAPDDDMTQRAGVALYLIAQRLIAELLDD